MLVIPFLILCISAIVALIVKPSLASRIGCLSVVVGSGLMIPATLLGDAAGLPDRPAIALSVFFMLPIVVLGITAAIHSTGYLKGHGAENAGKYWFFFNLMLASMFGVTVLDHPIHFLFAWELMGITSAALVAFDHRARESMRAVWIYLAACHAGVVFLILMFVELGSAEPYALTVFILAMLGFGLKAGFTGLHIWLPEAHPAAPAPVSAIMSGAMINLGLFGILKFGIIKTLGELPFNVIGWTFLVLGITGSLLGILFALPQKNLKRLLAFSSIENMGIITIAMGLFALGRHYELDQMTILAIVGAMLHILNHALLKGGLFLSAGSVYKATGSLNMDMMGGLMKRMPLTGSLFTLNAIGLSALPPLNGFIGEFFIYMAAFQGIVHASGALFYASFSTITTLALTGGLAVAVYAKATGSVFLGEPRSEHARAATEVPKSMTDPIIGLFILSLLVAFLGPLTLDAMTDGAISSFFPDMIRGLLAASLIFTLLSAFLLFFRFKALVRGSENIPGPTWDCGYARPTARMAYTGTAFTQPITDFMASILHPRRKLRKPESLFPSHSAIEVSVEDAGTRFLWGPLFGGFAKRAKKLHEFQSGSLHAYVLAMVVALAAMFIWAMSVHPELPTSVTPTESQPIEE